MTHGKRMVLELTVCVVIFLALAVVVLFSQGCSRKNPTAPRLEYKTVNLDINDPYKVLVVGNSLTNACGATQQTLGFAYRLQDKLQTYMPTITVELETSSDGYVFEMEYFYRGISDFDNLYTSDADLVVIQVGDDVDRSLFEGNPFSYRYAWDEYYANFVKSFAEAKEDRIVICVTTWFDWRHEFDTELTSGAARSGAIIADIHDMYSRDGGIMRRGIENPSGDPGIDIHPGDTGHDNIAQRIFDVLIKTLNY
jgi:hypothetical protein